VIALPSEYAGASRPSQSEPITPAGRAYRSERIPRYGDDVWPLRFLGDNPSVAETAVPWSSFPAGWREHFKFASWVLLNLPVPDHLLLELGRKARSMLGTQRLYHTIMDWRMLARWLDREGTCDAGEIDDLQLDGFVEYLRDERKASPATIAGYVGSVNRLWAIGMMVPELVVDRPQWLGGALNTYFDGMTTDSGGEALKEPIAAASISSLLAISLAHVQEIGPLLVEPYLRARGVSRWAAAQPRTHEPRRPLDEWLRMLQETGTPIAVRSFEGRLTVDRVAVKWESGATEAAVNAFLKKNAVAVAELVARSNTVSRAFEFQDAQAEDPDATLRDSKRIDNWFSRLEAARIPIPMKWVGGERVIDVDAVRVCLKVHRELVRDWSAQSPVLKYARAHDDQPARKAVERGELRASGRSIVRDWFATLRAAGQSVPTKPHAGKEVVNWALIAYDLGIPIDALYNSELSTQIRAYALEHHRRELVHFKVSDRVTNLVPAEIPLDAIQSLVRLVEASCFVVIAYLTGMRPGEVLALEKGSLDEPGPDEGWRFIRSRHFKTAVDQDGNSAPAGEVRDVPWVAIGPVAEAIMLLEELCDDRQGLLFATRSPTGQAGDGRSRTTNAINDAIADLIKSANGRSRGIVPKESHGAITSDRFRRTLAWHIANRPNGTVALSIQYNHASLAISESYAARGRGGMDELIDIERARRMSRELASAWEELEAGAQVSGPAASRFVFAARRHQEIFAGIVANRRQAKQLDADPNLRLYQNPDAHVFCMFRRQTAMCLEENDGEAINEPRLPNCNPRCGNIARIDSHAADMSAGIDVLRNEAVLSPGPLGHRLDGEADRLEVLRDEHIRARRPLRDF